MEITYYGKTCLKLKGKNSSIILDPFTSSAAIGKQEADVVALTSTSLTNPEIIKSEYILIDGAGEYEVKGINITGFAQKLAESSLDSKVTGYLITIEGLNCATLGNFSQTKLEDAQIEEMENVDILFVPINQTSAFDASVAAKISAQIEPALIIPIFPEGNQAELSKLLLKEMGKEESVPTKKLVITKDKLPEEVQIVTLEEN